MGGFLAFLMAVTMTLALGVWVGQTGTETKILGTCLIAREIQVKDTILYCKPIAVIVSDQRQELKNGSVTATQP